MPAAGSSSLRPRPAMPTGTTCSVATPAARCATAVPGPPTRAGTFYRSALGGGVNMQACVRVSRKEGRVRACAALTTLLLATGSPVWGVSYYLATDVPATLGGADPRPEPEERQRRLRSRS